MVNASIGASIYSLKTQVEEVLKGEFNWEQARLQSRRPLEGEHMCTLVYIPKYIAHTMYGIDWFAACPSIMGGFNLNAGIARR